MVGQIHDKLVFRLQVKMVEWIVKNPIDQLWDEMVEWLHNKLLQVNLDKQLVRKQLHDNLT